LQNYTSTEDANDLESEPETGNSQHLENLDDSNLSVQVSCIHQYQSRKRKQNFEGRKDTKCTVIHPAEAIVTEPGSRSVTR